MVLLVLVSRERERVSGSSTLLTVSVAVAEVAEKALEPPLILVSTRLPAVDSLVSQLR